MQLSLVETRATQGVVERTELTTEETTELPEAGKFSLYFHHAINPELTVWRDS